MPDSPTPPWFASWFDSPYYPILYQHRDEGEADRFVSSLLDHLQPSPGSYFLDLACGRGRHARHIHQAGFKVLGLDLSPASIADAQKHSAPGLEFQVADMRDPLPGKFDYIFNLFTSFGYFESAGDNARVLQNIAASLNPDGLLVLDYLNTAQVIPNMVPAESKELDGVQFEIRRSVQINRNLSHIVKDIEIRHGKEEFHFQERVQALTPVDFNRLMVSSGLAIVDRWGDYEGGDFVPEESPRLILFCKLLSAVK